MEIIEYNFNGIQVIFDIQNLNKDLMVNATELAKPFNKKVKYFLELESTKEYIDAILRKIENEKVQKSSSKVGISDLFDIHSKHDIYKTKQNFGTYMHRLLAYKFAAWLSPDFELCVYEVFDKFQNGLLHEIKEVTNKKYELQRNTEKTFTHFDWIYSVDNNYSRCTTDQTD